MDESRYRFQADDVQDFKMNITRCGGKKDRILVGEHDIMGFPENERRNPDEEFHALQEAFNRVCSKGLKGQLTWAIIKEQCEKASGGNGSLLVSRLAGVLEG